ncbi:MAG TPA: hypothetical protein VFG81_07080 [Anaerolineales bacterium]|jgi:hypothetical protein|nr:hypothetical protein [Anaerolineales bacterium]
MNIKKGLPILLLVVLVLICGLVSWARNSPLAQDYFLIHRRETEYDLAFAFAVSLRNNDPAAYEMVDPTLKPRLDDWMNTHRGKKCTNWADTVFLGAGTTQGYQVILDCFGENNWLSFKVDNIVIKDMMVIDWGEVKEGIGLNQESKYVTDFNQI